MGLVNNIQIKTPEWLPPYISKLGWVFLLCFAFCGIPQTGSTVVSKPLPLLEQTHSNEDAQVFIALATEDDDSSNDLFDEDSDDDDDSSSLDSAEDASDAVDFSFIKRLQLPSCALTLANCSLPLYILYCNWKYHLVA